MEPAPCRRMPAIPTNESVPPLRDSHFVNPIGEGADPWVVRDEANDRYLWCFSEGNRAIAIHTGKNLSDLGTRHIVWQAPDAGPCSKQVWAPELHQIGEKWYIYFAASDGKNKNHRAYVLESKTRRSAWRVHDFTDRWPPETEPMAASPNLWAIDMTPLSTGASSTLSGRGGTKPG